MLGISVIGRRYLDDIGRDEVDTFEAADDGAKFTGGPPAGFGGTGCGSDWMIVC